MRKFFDLMQGSWGFALAFLGILALIWAVNTKVADEQINEMFGRTPPAHEGR